MTSEELNKISEIFPQANFEAIDGIWIFDKSNKFIGAYLNEGFSLSMKYKHADKVKERLEEYGYKCWWHEILQESQHDKLMDELDQY